MSALGRIAPPDWEHVEKYPLRALDTPPTHVPVVVGANWYTNFDSPVKHADGSWSIGSGDLGSVRGGHCFALEPAPQPDRRGKEQDNLTWWPFYDQGREGACVGFGCTRTMSLLNRKRYDAFWLYHEAQVLGGYVGQEGANVRDGLEVLRTEGHRVAHGRTASQVASDPARPSEGIAAYRWATGVDEVLAALGTPGASHVTILNSWGEAYPHRTLLSTDTLSRLLSEGGEAGVVTDR